VPAIGRASKPGVIWTNAEEHGIKEALHEVIGLARKSLVLSTFSLNGMTEKPEILLAPLEKALKNGNVKADLILRARNGYSSHRRDTQTLSDMGVEIHADSMIHAKGVIADATAGALFSANFDAQHGMISGTEVGVRLDGTQALQSALRFFHHVIRNSTARFVRRPTHREMHDGFAVHWNSRWPIDSEVMISCPDKVWESFTRSAIKGPVLFERDEKSFRIFAGLETWRLVPAGDSLPCSLDPENVEKPGQVSSREILANWLRLPYEKSKRVDRGFCPAVFTKSS
jgi:hypothetical protein